MIGTEEDNGRGEQNATIVP